MSQSITSLEQLQKITSSGKAIIEFWAEWSAPSKTMHAAFEELAKKNKGTLAHFLTVEAEEVGDVTEKYGIDSVPSFVFVNAGKVIETVKGADSQALNQKVTSFIGSPAAAASPSVTNSKESLNERLKSLINKDKVMGFIKGTPEHPQCGFSNKFCQILKEQGVTFSTFNILEDQDVRNGLKEYSNWPTYPQLYINGKLIGGLDILKELVADGSFKLSLIHI
eukprot:TRINITY_DN10506_c0_g1_i1.p1 TRINITY_DN10506_c0_g1~~TRINITY_DN10506_c0_g1_i1.p1  ORF type:complete len:222 (+),score=55.82 TRINITY_DN10506_c0_g1_i1:34-699(+)